MQEEALTVAEAAVRLGVNDKTVRRWVKAGRLSATLTDGPYGKQYRIPADALGAAQQALAVGTVDRGTDPRALALAVVKALEPRDAVLRADVDVMRQEIAALRALLEERLPLPVRGVQTPGQDDQGPRNGAVVGTARSPVGSNLMPTAPAPTTDGPVPLLARLRAPAAGMLVVLVIMVAVVLLAWPR